MVAHGGAITQGSPNVLIGGVPAARLGDPIMCPVHGPGMLTKGSSTVLINGRPAARLTDTCICRTPGTVLVGNPTVLIGTGGGGAPPNPLSASAAGGGVSAGPSVPAERYGPPAPPIVDEGAFPLSARPSQQFGPPAPELYGPPEPYGPLVPPDDPNTIARSLTAGEAGRRSLDYNER